MAFRFLHTGDWQIGLQAKQLGERGEVAREARFTAAERVIALANREQVQAVLLAGDTFEDSSIERSSIQRVVDILRQSNAPVFVLSGNHDPLVAHGVFDHPAWREAAATVTVLRDATPIDLGGAVLLPSPIRHRHSTQDPLEALPPLASPSPVLRIGLAHGSVVGGVVPTFPGATEFPIDLRRLEGLGLDYLALGHWHCPEQFEHRGVTRVAYAGTHEPTAFGEVSPDGRFRSGQCLVVTLEAGVAPRIEAHRTAELEWETWSATVSSADDLTALRAQIDAQPPESRRCSLLRLDLQGELTVSEAAALSDLEDLAAARFLFARLRRGKLRVRPEDAAWVESLPLGAPRAVAQALLREASGTGPEAAVAERALLILYQLQHAPEIT